MKALTKKFIATITGIITVFSLATTVLADNPPATVVAPPVPVQNLRDDGTWHELVTPGTASGGFMQYSIDGVTWFTTLPAATSFGTYTSTPPYFCVPVELFKCIDIEYLVLNSLAITALPPSS